MKRFILLIAAAISLQVYAADKVIELKKPNLARKATLMNALENRKSTREFAQKKLSVDDLSDLLWAANGINRPKEDKRTAPSAMNRQDVDVYVILPEGAYLYDAKAHRLNLVVEQDLRPAIAASQDYVKNAPVVLLLVTDVSKLGNPSDETTKLMCAADVGIVSQNISLFCSAADLATVPRGFMEKEKIIKALKLKDSQMPILNHPVGYFK